ncbi:MAG: fibronectin type III domain-containing protein [Verrucomicrobiota bacterium]
MFSRHFPSILFFHLVCGTSLAGAATVPAPTIPSNLRVKPLGVNSFLLEWKDNSNNEVGWEILAAVKGSAPKRYALHAVPNATSYIVTTNDLPGKELSFQLRAYNGAAGAEKFSKKTSIVTAKALASKTFDPPTKMKATVVDDGSIRISWKDNSTSENGYQMEYKISSAKKWTSLGATGPDLTFNVPLTGLEPSKSYSFRVRAFRNTPAKATAYSKVAKAKTKAFLAPTNLAVTAEGDGAFTFDWKDKSSLETGYDLQFKGSTGDFTSLDPYAANTTRVPDITGADLETTYQFRVRAIRTVGTTSVYSGFSNTVSIKSSTLAAPTTLAGTGASDSSVTLTWKKNSTRSSGHDIEYREAGSSDTPTIVTVGNVQTYTLTGLEPGKLYEIRLRASVTESFVSYKSTYTDYIQVRAKDGIAGDFHPQIFYGASFLYPIQVSRLSALTSLSVTGLPAGLVHDPVAHTISGSATEDGAKTVTLTANFNDGSTVTKSLILRIVRPPAAPVVSAAFDPVNVAATGTSTVSLTGKFADPDTASAARFVTSSGTVDIILYSLATPATVTNFLNYLDAGRYDDGFFHRSVADAEGSLYIVQGGGYQYTSTTGFTRVTKNTAIQNEPGISNLKGTVAMAKVSGSPNSATSEFFVNLNNVNAGNLDKQNEGFTVFGRVSSSSLAVMEAINALPTKDYTVLIGTGTQSLEDVPISTTTTAVPIDPALLIKVPSAGPAPILSYEVVSQDTAVATASVTGTDITITGVATGTTTIKVKATDLDGESTTQNITVTVP